MSYELCEKMLLYTNTVLEENCLWEGGVPSFIDGINVDMKVLHLISGGDTGGAKTHVISLIKEMQKNIDVKVICFMDGIFYREALENGINIHLIEQQKRYNLSVTNRLAQFIVKEGFDLIHSHGARANFITFFLRKKINLPVITTIHSDYKLDFKGNFYKDIFYTALNAFSLRFIDYYICISDNFKQMMIERGFKRDKLFTVYNGIDFNIQLKPLEKKDYLKSKGISWENNWPIIGILGRLHPVKGQKVFLDAAKIVSEKYPQARFLLGGDGDERGHLENHSNDLGLGDKVRFIGYEEDAPSFFNALDINVLTSLSESFPYVLLEGARQKKATISSNVGGIGALILEGKTGYLFKSEDSVELADKITKMIENPKNISILGENLYKHTLENFSVESMYQNHIEIYKSLFTK